MSEIVYVRVAHNFVDLTGRRFGRLVPFEYLGSIKKHSRWGCRCDCGAIASVSYQNLVKGHTQSCGCLHREELSSRATHGMRHSPEYQAWCRMRQRCSNPNVISWCDYGGRGISVVPEWHDFAIFFKHVGPKPSPLHTLDRIDNDGNYEPGNVRWATASVQNRNRRPWRKGVSLRRELSEKRRAA